jgi:GTP pyrophosphokinase
MSKQPLLDISDILERIPPGEQADDARTLIKHAYAVAEQAHAGQIRKSGEPYIQHPLAVALLLADMRMDPVTIAAGLLHDVVEDSDVDLKWLAQEFGPYVASLVDGMTKLEQIDKLSQKSEGLRNEQESESLRKMFIAMAEDIRVVIIKLADRMHNMRTLAPLSEKRRKAFARETLEIFAPLANRLGVWQWKWELEQSAVWSARPAFNATPRF